MIMAFAIFNFYTLYTEVEEKFKSVVSQEDIQRLQLAKNKKTQKEITNYYKNINEEKERIERVAKEIEKTQQLLPGEISDSENINLLRKMADDVNIKELSITPDRDYDRGFFIARKYRIKARATFLQFLIMFEKIAENKRILNVGESIFRKSTEPQKGKFQVIDGNFMIEAYKFNSEFKEDRGIDEIEKKFKDPVSNSRQRASGGAQ